jgi:tryptophanyl-tRNA synthetase
MTRVLSGIQPSGKMHLGNYCGAIRQFLDLQAAGNEIFIFVASYHALTSTRDPAALREHTRQAVIDYLAYGLDPAKTSIYVQHDLPEVCELAWMLGCVCPMSWMEKAVSYKDKVSKGLSASVGLFTYPVLQAADILAVDAEVVPVGRDQVQHLELTRDIAGRFNEVYGAEVFTLPSYRLAADADVVPGVDGEKMSKSYGNTIDPFEDEKPLRKRVMSIVTDSKAMEESKDPETCTIFKIYRAVAGKEDPRTLSLAERYRAGGMGYGHAKQALFDLLLEHFGPARSRRQELLAKPDYVDQVLRQGAHSARLRARATLTRARHAVGLSSTP